MAAERRLIFRKVGKIGFGYDEKQMNQTQKCKSIKSSDQFNFRGQNQKKSRSEYLVLLKLKQKIPVCVK